MHARIFPNALDALVEISISLPPPTPLRDSISFAPTPFQNPLPPHTPPLPSPTLSYRTLHPKNQFLLSMKIRYISYIVSHPPLLISASSLRLIIVGMPCCSQMPRRSAS